MLPVLFQLRTCYKCAIMGGIKCFLQDGSGINTETDLVVVSTAIEDTVYEVQKARELNIPILKD